MTTGAKAQRRNGAPWNAALATAVAQQHGPYRLRLARPGDLEAVFALRFRVFNVELDEGLDAAWVDGLDEDGFDRQCHHLLVEHESGDIVGTYRMQDQAMARAGGGFYSAAEFDVESLGADLLSGAVELGRACIAQDHRNTRVLFLLWRGLAAYMMAGGHRWFFGCCSLTSRDPLEGHRLLRALRESGAVDDRYHAPVCAAYRCPGSDDGGAAPRVPKLMRLYLAYGARIVGGPALDREFGTIDFLTLFDLDALEAQHRRMFLDPA